MAKKATFKPAAKAAATKTAAVSTALPTFSESAQRGAEQGMAAPLSPEALDTPLVETPPGVSGVSSPVAPLSEIVVTDVAGDTYEEGDIQPEIVVGVDESPYALLPPVAAKAPLEDHPAIELAQSFVTPHGVPASGHQHYYTPPPPELRKKAHV